MAFTMEKMGSCCVARVIDDWQGQEYPTTMWIDHKRFPINNKEDYFKMATVALKKLCEAENASEERDEDSDDEYDDLRNKAIYTATLREDQVWAMAFARQVGFTRTRLIDKGRYRNDSQMRLLWISSLDLFKWYEGVK